MESTQALTISDGVMIFAVILAPVLAVQVQKWIEGIMDDKARKIRVFKSLMATRAATVSAEHVQALNMIDLEFQGNKFKNVTGAWKTYLDHLGSYPKDDEKMQPVWGDKRIDLLARLLQEMGRSLGYEFDDVHIRKGIYAPEAHAQIEDEQLLIRRGLIRILYGETAIQMDVASFPIGEREAAEQAAIRQGLIDIVKGDAALQVNVRNK